MKQYDNKQDSTSADCVRLDKWLWAARFYKTRQLAAQAIKGGKVEIDGDRAKPAKSIRTGDTVTLKRDGFTYIIKVLKPHHRRVAAALVSELYKETDHSIATRLALADERKIQRASFQLDRGKPTKQNRRLLTQFKRGGTES